MIRKEERVSFLAKMGTVFFIVLIGLISYFRAVYSSPFARSWDQVDFSLALERFDLLAMQPHFPGYPYFVFGGMIFNQWIDDPAQALSVFNTIMLLLASLPIYWLARRHLPTIYSLFVCATIQSLAYLWIMATEPMSEAAAVSVLWWYLWSLQRANEDRLRKITLLPLFLFSVLMGIRLSYLPFGLGILLLIYSKRKLFLGKQEYLLYIVKLFTVAILFQLIWVMGLVATEGSLRNFLSLSFQFVFGHFNDWGGAVTAESTPLLQRFSTLLFINIFWIGIFGESIYTAILMGFLLVLIGVDYFKNGAGFSYSKAGASLLMVSYFAWALFAQNIDKPRHALPLIALIPFFIFITALKAKRNRVIKIMIILCIFIIQSVHGYGFVKQKASEAPATYQLANYLSDYKEPFVVYTWEEARIMDYLEVNYPYERILTYEYFMSNVEQRKDKKILMTDHVLEGFKNQGIPVDEYVQEIKSFQSNPLFDPVYSKITLYEWKK